jgi:hypothetical protein
MSLFLPQKSPKRIKYRKPLFLALIVFGFTKSGYSQTFPVLPSPYYNERHVSFVKGSLVQDGSSGIAGILVKLKNAAGDVISSALTNDEGNYTLTAKAESGNYSLEIEYPSEGYTLISSPSVFSLSGNQTQNGMDFYLNTNPNTLTVCDAYTSGLIPGGLSSTVSLNINKPDISIAYSAVKLFTSAMTNDPELDIENTNDSESARITRLEVGAIVYHQAPGSSSSINSFMEFAKNDIGGSQNLVVPASATYTYHDLSSGKTWTSGNLSNAAYATDGSAVQIQIAADAQITSSLSGGEATFTTIGTNVNAGACLVYTYASNPLPVRLVSFDATKQNGEPALLKWKTAQEELSKEFQVEKSMNAIDWTTIGTVATTNKGVSLAEYQFYDNENWVGNTYYRLKMVDMDGSFAYSQIRSLTRSESADKLALFPNPISSSGQKLQFTNLPSQLQKIELISIAGIVTYSIEKPSSQGINIEGVSKGLYIIKAILQNGQIFSSRLLIK